jgi:kumamolisin
VRVSSAARSPLPGSESRPPPHGAELLGPVDSNERIEVSVLVRPRHPLDDIDARLSRAQPYLSREEFAATYGADARDMARLVDFARQHGLEVVESSPARRTIRLSGRPASIEEAFGVALERYRLPDGTTFQTYTGPILVPTDLHGIVQAVFGLDTRPVAHRDC